MSNTLFAKILLLTLIPMLTTIAGAVVASLRPPSDKMRSIVQHFAAGVVLAAVAGELLPEITRGHEPLGVVIGFVLGVALMLSVKSVAARFEGDGSRTGKSGLVFAVAVDVLVDGLLIGVGFAAGERVGTLLVVALTLELFFLGMSVASSLIESGAPRGRCIAIVSALSLLVVLGATVGAFLLAGLSGLALEIVLSFGAAALLYLVIEELLTEAHTVEETPLITTSFFAGFVTLYLIELAS